MKAIAVSGFADAMRKSPVVYALVLEALAIVALAWVQISDSRAERQEHAEYVHALHSQLVECHRDRN